MESNGYKIICLNYRCLFGEIDIIAHKDDVFVFVEVKTRSNNKMGFPVEAVTYSKQQKILNVADQYLSDKDDYSARFDIIEVYVELISGCVRRSFINHIENAFGRW